jgi:hypothetical protein
MGMGMDLVLLEPICNATYPSWVVASARILPAVQRYDCVDEASALFWTDISHVAADAITRGHLDN